MGTNYELRVTSKESINLLKLVVVEVPVEAHHYSSDL